MAQLVLEETGLLPHINAGVMDRDQIAKLRGVSVSQGLMLESASERLCRKGGDKQKHCEHASTVHCRSNKMQLGLMPAR